MEPDFSIRKEVEAIQNESSEFRYAPPPESPFDEFIQRNEVFEPAHASNSSPYSSHSLIQQQQALIHSQQMFNLAMVREMAKQKSEPWKWAAVISMFALAYFLLLHKREVPYSERLGPRKRSRKRSRKRRRNLITEEPLFNKFNS
jgi:hypothetical protein